MLFICKFIAFMPALVVDRQNVLSLDICRLKYSNGECNEIDADGQLEPMEWMHLCTTFEVWEEDGLAGNWEARTTTYRDGIMLTMGNLAHLGNGTS